MHKAVGLFEKGVPGATQMGNDHAGCINWYFVTRLRRDAAVFVRRVRIVAVRIEFLRDSAIRFVQPCHTAMHFFFYVQLGRNVAHYTTLKPVSVWLIDCENKLQVRSVVKYVIDRFANTVKVADRDPWL